MDKKDIRRRKPRIAPDILEAIDELGSDGLDAPGIARELERRIDAGGLPESAAVPSEKSIRRRLADRTPSALWGGLAASSGSAASLVLPVLAAAVERTQGRRFWLTEREAHWIVKLRQAAPDLPPWWAFYLASRKYIVRQDHGELTQDLDLLLAFAPWQSDDAFQRFVRAVPPEWVLGDAQGHVSGAVMDAMRMHIERTGESVDVILERVRNELKDKLGEEG